MPLLFAKGLLVFSRLCTEFGPPARMVQVEDWFRSWVPALVFSASGGRGSVEAWYTTAVDIEEVLSGATRR